MTEEELEFLQKRCSYLSPAYLKYLSEFRLKPSEQLEVSFIPIDDTGSKDDMGDVKIAIKGLWIETILYEIPLLALTSETYFKFCDRDWDYHQQEEKAFRKGCALLENGCIFSEFGTRRRRDYHTQNLVMEGLTRAVKKGAEEGFKGKLAGTSNVHFAMKYGIDPVGTVAHEWYMGIAAITDNYENANEIALRYWLGCFGEGVSISFFQFHGIIVAADANFMLYRFWVLPLRILLEPPRSLRHSESQCQSLHLPPKALRLRCLLQEILLPRLTPLHQLFPLSRNPLKARRETPPLKPTPRFSQE